MYTKLTRKLMKLTLTIFGKWQLCSTLLEVQLQSINPMVSLDSESNPFNGRTLENP
jgi:hypothetical protein